MESQEVVRLPNASYWEAMYLRAKEDNRALHKGIKRLKNKEKQLLEQIDYLEKHIEGLTQLLQEPQFMNSKAQNSIECKMNLHRVGGTD